MNDPREEDLQTQLPPKLSDKLRSVRGDAVPPQAVDDQIRRHIHTHFARKAQYWRPTWWRYAVGAATAACLAIVLTIFMNQSPQPTQPSVVQSLPTYDGPHDFNNDGRLDIRDVLLLAKATRSGEELGMRWDVNGDLAVTPADADELARRLTSLQRWDRP